jgi:hypothetical protein
LSHRALEPVGGGQTTALAMQASFYGTEPTWVPGLESRCAWPILEAMSVWLKVSLIVFAAVVVSIGISLVPRGGGLPSLPSSSAMQKSLQQTDPLIEAVFIRPRQAAVDACSRSREQDGELTHADIVHIATCLNRRHLVSAKTVAAVKSDTSLGGGTGIVGLKSKSETVWWSFAIWGVALALIILVVYRHRRPPPGPALPTTG